MAASSTSEPPAASATRTLLLAVLASTPAAERDGDVAVRCADPQLAGDRADLRRAGRVLDGTATVEHAHVELSRTGGDLGLPYGVVDTTLPAPVLSCSVPFWSSWTCPAAVFTLHWPSRPVDRKTLAWLPAVYVLTGGQLDRHVDRPALPGESSVRAFGDFTSSVPPVYSTRIWLRP